MAGDSTLDTCLDMIGKHREGARTFADGSVGKRLDLQQIHAVDPRALAGDGDGAHKLAEPHDLLVDDVKERVVARSADLASLTRGRSHGEPPSYWTSGTNAKKSGIVNPPGNAVYGEGRATASDLAPTEYPLPGQRSFLKAGRLGFGSVSAAERRALNEKVFREMNERVERLGEEFGDDAVEFLCECADPACSTPLSIQVYETVRDHPRWFVVVPGHER